MFSPMCCAGQAGCLHGVPGEPRCHADFRDAAESFGELLPDEANPTAGRRPEELCGIRSVRLCHHVVREANCLYQTLAWCTQRRLP